MPARPAARQRLADLMERRRLDLGLTWREVAEAGNISYEVIRAIRHGNGQIRPLSKRGIEVGLHWESGSVQDVLDDRDPTPIPAEPAPAALVSLTNALGDDVKPAVVAALYGPAERRIWARVRRHLASTPSGRELFSDPGEAAAWPPESPDGSSGGAPFEMTDAARELLDAIPAAELFADPYEVIIWNLDKLQYRKRVSMIREYREPVRELVREAARPPRAARRAGLRKPGTLTA